jgi:sugar phosphate isomerase/epimerase
MKRILTVCLLMAFIGLPMVITSCKKAEKTPIGLQLYSVRDDMQKDVAGTIEKVGLMGYDYVEPAGYWDGKFYNMEPADFKSLVEKNGMTIVSSHTGMPVPDSAKWDSTMIWWDKCIAAHKAAGVSYIIQPFMDSIGYQTLAGLKRYCDYFNAIGAKCNAAGIKFGYHNHSGEFAKIDSTVIYDFMLKNTDPNLVFFQMDLWWIYKGGGNYLEYWQKYPGRFTILHIKDLKEVGASGEIDWKPIFENAPAAGTKYYTVEQEEYETSALDGASKSLEFLKKSDFVK